MRWEPPKKQEITICEVNNWLMFDGYPANTLVVAIRKIADFWDNKLDAEVRVGYLVPEISGLPWEDRDYERVYMINGVAGLSDLETNDVEFSATKSLRGSEMEGDMRVVRRYVGADEKRGFFLGITTHVGGGSWSSSQLHNFELAQIMSPLVEPFPEFKEYFAFFTHPSGMWGLQVHGQNKPGEVAVVKDGDIIDVPIGPHAVVAGPGTRLGYIWIYTGAWSKEL